MSKRKPILSFDFDGVIHSYTSGWKGATNIPDPPVDGAFAYMIEALATGWDVVIHSSRGRYLFGPWAMRKWLRKHGGNLYYDSPAGPGLESVRICRFKPPATFTIDDRCATFQGVWWPLSNMREWKPWNKGGYKATKRTVESVIEEHKGLIDDQRKRDQERRDRPWTPSRFA